MFVDNLPNVFYTIERCVRWLGLPMYRKKREEEEEILDSGIQKMKKEGLSVLILCALVFAVLFLSFGFPEYNISMPIAYNGGDDFSVYKNAKMLSEGSGWISGTPRLGAPFGAEYHDFMPDALMNVDNLLIKFFGIFTDDIILNVNLTVFFLFFAIAGTAYYALRQMGVRNDFAIMGAVTFDFMYYHFMRMIAHFSLGAYEFVPLSVLLCVWLWKDEKLFVYGKEFFRYKKNYLVILFALLIANNGIAYYAFFTCMFLGITGISKTIKEKKLRYLGKMCGMIAPIVLFMAVSLIPSMLYQLENGFLLTSRQIGDSELYAMKIIQLLIPYKDYGIQKLQDFHNEYYKVFTFTEAFMSYLGLVAGVGFLFLLFAILRKRTKESDNKSILTLLIELNIFAVLFATMGGFSSIFANFVMGLIRGVNRISIFIGFFSIAALCIVMTKMVKHEFVRFKRAKGILYVLFVVFVVLGLKDQIPDHVTGNSAVYAEERASDEEFIQSIERQLPAGAMIYQLPYHPYPEGGPVLDLADYHLLVGYLYSDTLRWSYGGSKGREGDQWNKEMSEKELPEMVEALKKEGFAGIYLDKRAYEEAVFDNIYNVINVCLGYEPSHSRNENLYFWKFE